MPRLSGQTGDGAGPLGTLPGLQTQENVLPALGRGPPALPLCMHRGQVQSSPQLSGHSVIPAVPEQWIPVAKIWIWF